MYINELKIVSHSARNKMDMFEDSIAKYGVSSMLGGLYVCFGTMLSYVIGGLLGTADSPWTKIIMGLSFGIALCLIVFAGADLFTSNTMTMVIGANQKETKYIDIAKICGFSWLGNFLGSIIAAGLFVEGGLINESTAYYMVKTVESKISITAPEMIIRGIFCNILVCLACWMGYKMKSESGKIMMILWCVFAFMTAGYEHSIANMGLFAIVKLIPAGSGIALGAMAKNLIFVTIGNFIGGAGVVAGSYIFLTGKKKK